ncbi:hypothetical protein K788_0005902 [Paraburkholderia caribensis MBA4]|uniref:Uncharacterized protein n=1 Tax=Paraburkholderia caribensis MBA4 TaxID=1323664 RepID=A0A0P0R4C0_9BURK|nr:hypothetical protein K788_0005902 [Paraburkholderia caribensis MBA4]
MRHTVARNSLPVANASNERFARVEYPYPVKRQRMVRAAQVANCV